MASSSSPRVGEDEDSDPELMEAIRRSLFDLRLGASVGTGAATVDGHDGHEPELEPQLVGAAPAPPHPHADSAASSSAAVASEVPPRAAPAPERTRARGAAAAASRSTGSGSQPAAGGSGSASIAAPPAASTGSSTAVRPSVPIVPLVVGASRATILLPGQCIPQDGLGRSYAVWKAPGSAQPVVGVHCGRHCWWRLQPLLQGGAYQTGRDKLRGFRSFEEAITEYAREAAAHQASAQPVVYYWP